MTAVGLVAALVAGSTRIAYQYQRDIVRARARTATGSRVISTPCGPIEYAEVGSGPVILPIHGAGGGFDQGRRRSAPYFSVKTRCFQPMVGACPRDAA